MNKISVCFCIAILIGQTMLFSPDEGVFDSSSDSEFDWDEIFPASGRNGTEEPEWEIQTIDTNPSTNYIIGNYNSLAVDELGTPHISYISPSPVGSQSYVLNYTYLDGESWITNNVVNSNGGSCIALDSLGVPNIGVYHMNNALDLYLATTSGQNASSWNFQTIDNSSSSNVGSHCSLKIGSNGDIYAVYWVTGTNYSSLNFAHYNGTSWSISVVDSNGGASSSLMIDSSNNLHLTYQDTVNGVLKYGFYNGQSWSISTIDSSTSGRSNSLDIDSNGNPHVSYFSPAANSVKYATYANTVWSISTIRTGLTWDNSTASETDTSLSIDSFDNIHISFFDSGGLTYGFHDGGNSWGFTLIDTVQNVEGNTNIVVDESDTIHISYHDYVNKSLKYATFTSPEDSSGFEVLDSLGDVGQYISIASDSNADNHISYYDVTNGDLKYATDKSGSWVYTTLDSTGIVGMDTSIALDSNDDVHISYWDATNADLKYATDKSGSWVTSTLDFIGDVGRDSSIAIDSNDDVHISYYD